MNWTGNNFARFSSGVVTTTFSMTRHSFSVVSHTSLATRISICNVGLTPFLSGLEVPFHVGGQSHGYVLLLVQSLV